MPRLSRTRVQRSMYACRACICSRAVDAVSKMCYFFEQCNGAGFGPAFSTRMVNHLPPNAAPLSSPAYYSRCVNCGHLKPNRAAWACANGTVVPTTTVPPLRRGHRVATILSDADRDCYHAQAGLLQISDGSTCVDYCDYRHHSRASQLVYSEHHKWTLLVSFPRLARNL